MNRNDWSVQPTMTRVVAGQEWPGVYTVHFSDGHATTLHANTKADAASEATRIRSENGWDPVPWPDGVHTCGQVMFDNGAELICPHCLEGHELKEGYCRLCEARGD